MMTSARTDTLPWYRQFWPWFLIALPASTVLACMVTIWLAVTNPDAIVTADMPYGTAYRPQSEVRSAYGADAAAVPAGQGGAAAREVRRLQAPDGAD
jgi:hypothetical protein